MSQANGIRHSREQEAMNHELVVSSLRFGRLPQTSREASFLLVAAEALSGRPDDKVHLHTIATQFFVRSNTPIPSLLDDLKETSVTGLPRLRSLLDFRLAHRNVE
jgi:hypothetical protein